MSVNYGAFTIVILYNVFKFQQCIQILLYKAYYYYYWFLGKTYIDVIFPGF